MANLPTNDINNLPSPTAATTTRTSGRHPFYHGIRCRGGKWVSEIRNKSTRIWLGTYATPEMAAAAYDAAALTLKGSYAMLNFPDSALPTPRPECPTIDDIRSAAATAAAARQYPRANDVGGGSATKTETGNSSRGEFMDHEAVFDMPNMLRNMAEGMMMSPPRGMSFVSAAQEELGESSGGWNLWDY